MQQIVLDTNCLLRWLLDDIPDQVERVDALMHRAKEKKVLLIIPTIVLFEVCFALEKFYHQPKISVIETLETLVAAPYLDVEEDQIFLTALNVYRQHTTSLVDCYLVAKTRSLQAELITFDKKLQKLLDL